MGMGIDAGSTTGGKGLGRQQLTRFGGRREVKPMQSRWADQQEVRLGDGIVGSVLEMTLHLYLFANP
jgi:hypothetical protein